MGRLFWDGRGNPASWAARLCPRRLAPRPDALYLLELPAETASARSTSAPALRLSQEQATLYRALAGDEFGAIRVDALRPAAELEDEIAYRTLTTYFDRYHTLINTLFFRNPGPLPALYFAPAPTPPTSQPVGEGAE